MESFLALKTLKVVRKWRSPFFSIKNVKSHKAVMGFFLSFRSFKSHKKVTESFFSDHASLSFHMMQYMNNIFLSVPSQFHWLYISILDQTLLWLYFFNYKF